MTAALRAFQRSHHLIDQRPRGRHRLLSRRDVWPEQQRHGAKRAHGVEVFGHMYGDGVH
jgi:hypothetical protein